MEKSPHKVFAYLRVGNASQLQGDPEKVLGKLIKEDLESGKIAKIDMILKGKVKFQSKKSRRA